MILGYTRRVVSLHRIMAIGRIEDRRGQYGRGEACALTGFFGCGRRYDGQSVRAVIDGMGTNPAKSRERELQIQMIFARILMVSQLLQGPSN